MEKFFMVIHEDRADVYITHYDNLQEANKEAKNQWDYLTYKEKARSRIYVAFTMPTEAFYEQDMLALYGTSDFEITAFHSSDMTEECFDSFRL